MDKLLIVFLLLLSLPIYAQKSNNKQIDLDFQSKVINVYHSYGKHSEKIWKIKNRYDCKLQEKRSNEETNNKILRV